MERIVLLNSGGLDSALVARWLSDKGEFEVHSLFVDTMQVNRAQTSAAAAVTGSRYCSSHKEIVIDFGQISNYWEDADGIVDMYETVESPSEEYASRPFQQFHVCPNLSMLFISMGVAYAKTIGATKVYTGHRMALDDNYLLNYNTTVSMSKHRFVRAELVIPFSDKESYACIRQCVIGEPTPDRLLEFRGEFMYTHSCRLATHCGVCEKCTGRAEVGLD